jgi:DNA-binding PadR family transcriptional regulator
MTLSDHLDEERTSLDRLQDQDTWSKSARARRGSVDLWAGPGQVIRECPLWRDHKGPSRPDGPDRTVHCGIDLRKSWTAGRESGSVDTMAEGVNATAAALLGLLHDGSMTGGQLMAAAERRLGPYWSMTRSQVYRELPALAEMGYVKMGKPGPRASQPYSITPAGKRAFARWLSEEPGPESLRNPVALRVAFGAHHGGPALKELYDKATDAHTAALADVREQARLAKAEGDNYGAAALEFAVGYHKAALAWLKAAPVK